MQIHIDGNVEEISSLIAALQGKKQEEDSHSSIQFGNLDESLDTEEIGFLKPGSDFFLHK